MHCGNAVTSPCDSEQGLLRSEPLALHRRRLDQTSMSNFEGSPAAGATPTRHRQSLGAPPEQVCYPSHGSSGGGGAAEPAYQQQLPAPPTPSPQDIDRWVS